MIVLSSFTAIWFVLCLLPVTWKLWFSWCWLLVWVRLHSALCVQILFAVNQAGSSSFWSILSGTSEVTYHTEFLTGILQFLSAWVLIAQNKILKICGFIPLFFLNCVLHDHFAMWGCQFTQWNLTLSLRRCTRQSNDAKWHLYVKVNI